MSAPTRDPRLAQRGQPAPAGRALPLWYSLLLAAVVTPATLYGLLIADAYRVPAQLVVTWRAQDLITLLVVPVLLWSAVRARAGSLRAHLVWVGVVFWLTYAYAHYAFGVPYTDIFLLYVAALTLSAYGLLDGLLRVDVAALAPAFSAAPRRATAWYLLLGAVGFGALWLGEIAAAFPGGQPASNLVHDLPSPTYVLDLAWVIPLFLATARLLRRHHPAAPMLAATGLVWLLILSLAMLAMTPFMLADARPLDPVFTTIFSVLAILTTGILTIGAHHTRPPTTPWLRRSLWPGSDVSE